MDEHEDDNRAVYEVVYRDERDCLRIYARVWTYEEALSLVRQCEDDDRRNKAYPVRIRKEGEE